MPEGEPLSAERAARLRAYLQDEIDGAALYDALADAEPNPERAALLRRLAGTERGHAGHWQDQLRAAGTPLGDPRPSTRTRLLGWTARRLGARFVLPVARAMELKGGNIYAGDPDAGSLADDERRHARAVIAIAGDAGAATANAITDRERWHRARDGGGSLRAAIFGVNDGLVSNFSLVMGVAGANPGNRFVLLSGVAGLIAGACSMAAGEFVSVSAQRELFERQIALEREEVAVNPEEEREELALIYQAKGLSETEARALAQRLSRDPEVALDTLTREELGLDPAALGSPWGAALSSFVMFALGALLPVLPFLFGGGGAAISISALLSAFALLGVGSALSLLTGRSPLVSALRMLLIGGAAASVTFLVGRLIGVSVT